MRQEFEKSVGHEAINGVLKATGTGKGINTAYIERLNATFRASLAVLVRRGRAIAHKQVMLTASMHLVGCAYLMFLPRKG